MPDSPVLTHDDAAGASAPFAEFDPLLRDLLAVSLTAVNLLRPLYSHTGELYDFAIEYLNPAGQRMTGLPERPGETLRSRFPETFSNGVFDLYQRVFESGEDGRLDLNYQADDLDNYFHVAARRSGDLLVASFTDTADQPRTAVEVALRESQAAERAAQAEAARSRQQLTALFMQSPACIARLDGPNHVFSLVNPFYQQLTGGQPLLGLAMAEAIPELIGQPLLGLLDDVYRTGETHYGRDVPATLDRTNTGNLDEAYFNFIYQAIRDDTDTVSGVLIFAYDVTEQVMARHHVQELNEELAAINEELRASNDEFLNTNTALSQAQQQLQQLNHELETRVQERTQELKQAHGEAEVERHRLRSLIAEAPTLIARLRGPNHFVELANEQFRSLLGGRELAGRPYREALPDLENQPFFDQLDAVYRTGETYYGKEVPVLLDRDNSGQLRQDYFNYTYQATHDAAGQIDGILLFAEEVTEQEMARQERETQREQLHSLFMQAPAPIVILDGPEMVYQVVNPAYQRIFPGRELVNKPLLEALPELANTPIPEVLRQVYITGKPYQAQELPIRLARTESGPLEDMFFTFTYQARRNTDGDIDGVMAFAYEVTEQVTARGQVQLLNEELAAINEEMHATNEELGNSNSQLVSINSDLDNFVYTASHDLKAPISNIEGLLATLREELPTPAAGSEVALILDLIQNSVERFTHTISLLTDITKLQQEYNQFAILVALSHVIEEVRLDLAPLLTQVGGHLHVNVAATPTITFAEKNLRSVVYNLVSNALKYHNPARAAEVTIRSRVEAPYLVLEVEDNGLGLDLTSDHQLFGLFRRFHTHVEGSGVGLHMVKKLVENAGGKIKVESKVGQGSTFSVYFP
ncbi:PAS domain-containing protein [Hymenobacter sp. B1770]|uniref:PAS domain-containing sensor histidine kinase n=1 Tax=Hymenobacter sp. B1770 TaxID=1718788 RepID=UPI003CF698EE